MPVGDTIRRVVLRWRRLGLAGLVLLPLAITSGLGFLWLHERGWLLWFVLVTVAGFALARGASYLLRRRKPQQAPRARQLDAPQIDPEWNPHERAAYEKAQHLIADRLPAPIPWQSLPAEGLAVVELVAATLSGGKRTALDFTVPEGLLLIDRVSLRYREFLRRNVPFSDQLSVRALFWIWQRQDKALAAWETGFLAYRGVRLVLNPAVGLLREVERAVTAGLQDRLTDQFIRDAQAILLEEVAQAAVDLYSGRLRFSEAELMQIELGSESRDRSRLAQPDDPVRILVVGQVSAGKSTLINALVTEGGAETDMAPTTDRLTAHETVIDDIPCRFVDTMGLDGSDGAFNRLEAEMAEADLILWTLRTNRPGRGLDVALLDRFDAHFSANPARRRPPLVFVASAADTLLPGWPYPENHLPADAQERLGHAMAAIATDMNAASAIPVRAEPPEWNIDTLYQVISDLMTEALMAQRNRRRLTGSEGGLRLRENLSRAGRGLGQGARFLKRSLRQRGR
ncbi:MAG: 50S ribosome-binding GTPase [Rhodobacteraceae bacterium HLUCCA12]|nr:MAG: 50S ribosome-binding GTPase [Rhodobacteraceae bacterium HLUCCA12]